MQMHSKMCTSILYSNIKYILVFKVLLYRMYHGDLTLSNPRETLCILFFGFLNLPISVRFGLDSFRH